MKKITDDPSKARHISLSKTQQAVSALLTTPIVPD
jgi:hypothetical protein